MLGTDGWQIFLRHVAHEWKGAGYHSRMTTAFGKGVFDARVLHSASHEILRLLQWPRDRVIALKGETE